MHGRECEFAASLGSGCLSADDDALAAGRGWDLIVIGGGAAGVLVAVTAAGSSAVKLDPVTSAGDTVAFT